MEGVIEFNVAMQVDDLQFNIAMEPTEGSFSTGFDALQMVTKVEKDYELLDHKPSINQVVLIGNKTDSQLNLQSKMDTITNTEIEELLNAFI